MQEARKALLPRLTPGMALHPKEHCSLLLERGWRARILPIDKPTEEIYKVYPLDAPFAWRADLPVYTDGSCWMSSDKALCIASAAAVQVDQQGNLLRSVVTTLPEWLPHTAGMAEHYAVAMVHRLPRDGPLHMVTDCASVISVAAGRSLWGAWRTPFAGLWGEVEDTS